jgi:hypothetical protein
MTLLSAPSRARDARPRRGHLVPAIVSGVIGAAALVAVTYLLWPTFTSRGASDPERMPVSIGGTLFNVPTQAIRMKVQRRSGPQERVDLDFGWPGLEPGGSPKRISADQVDSLPLGIDMMFVSIAAHGNALAPEERARTIYPRYLENVASPAADGLQQRAFRADTPYAGEDLMVGQQPDFIARCSRDARTPGICMSDRRIEGADLAFRFPRSYLADWRAVATAMDRLAADLHR